MWKKAHILYLIIIYRQLIWSWGGLVRLVKLEYLIENSFDTKCRTGYNIVYSVHARFFFFSMMPEFYFQLWVARLFNSANSDNSKCFHRNGFEMYILIIIYTVCTCDMLVSTRILNSEISWFCFDFPKWGPVSFIITDFNVFRINWLSQNEIHCSW